MKGNVGKNMWQETRKLVATKKENFHPNTNFTMRKAALIKKKEMLLIEYSSAHFLVMFGNK